MDTYAETALLHSEMTSPAGGDSRFNSIVYLNWAIKKSPLLLLQISATTSACTSFSRFGKAWNGHCVYYRLCCDMRSDLLCLTDSYWTLSQSFTGSSSVSKGVSFSLGSWDWQSLIDREKLQDGSGSRPDIVRNMPLAVMGHSLNYIFLISLGWL